MMLHYWIYLVTGITAMMGFAFFNGISITLIIPLFDYVFNQNKVNVLYTDWSGFSAAAAEMLSRHFSASGGFISGLQNYSPLWESTKTLMLQTSSITLLYVLCIFVFCAIILKNLFGFTNNILFNTLRARTVRDIRSFMFRRYLSQSLDFFSKNRVGDALVRMMSDVEVVSDQFLKQFINALRELTTIVVFAIIAWKLNSKLMLYSIIVLPLFSIVISMLGKKLKKYAKRILEQLSSLFSHVEEILNSMKIVQAFRHEEHEIDSFNKINSRHAQLWCRSQNYSALNTPISELNTAITGILVMIIGGNMILDPSANFSLGEFTAFLFALFSMLHPLKVLTQVYTEIRKAMVSLDRIAGVMNAESRIKDSDDAVSKVSFDHALEFDKVSFHYKEGKPVIKDFSLVIPKGSKTAFVGASGGGKTTIANLTNRLYEVHEGSIKVDGIDIRKIKLDDLRRLFGVVTQDSVLFTKSVRENIAYGSHEAVTDEQVRAAGMIANADEFIQELPNKYDEVLGNKGSDLSGGQRQRLCIARAVVADPPILIFDEATSALDTDSEHKVQEAIDYATRNRTVIMIAHRLSTVLKADQIVVLEKGRIVGQGSHAELLKTCERYRHLYNIQSGAH
jgi:subfamily B ATP-binding cassette protein MsbA